MTTFLLIASIIGVINSFIIIVYSLRTKKGNKRINYLFAALIFALTVRISKSILLTFSDGLHDILLTFGLSGFLAIAPVYLLFIKSIATENYRIKLIDYLHFTPALLLLLIWFELDYIRSDYFRWNFVYQLIMLQYMIYLYYAIRETQKLTDEKKELKYQLNILSGVLLLIWFLYYLNAATHFFPYIAGAIIYSVIVYFSINLIINKGYILDFNPFRKYKKSGVDVEICNTLAAELTMLFENEKVFSDNTISLPKLAKRLNTSTHQLSQAINTEKQQTYYELLSNYRIAEAKNIILSNRAEKFENIAYEVGYNSISAFNSAFKKTTGLTPSQFKKNNE